MFNPIKLYRKSHETQWTWIRNHPVQYVALNSTIIAGIAAYMYYEDQRIAREMMKDYDERIQQD
jgi:hypothetical protein